MSTEDERSPCRLTLPSIFPTDAREVASSVRKALSSGVASVGHRRRLLAAIEALSSTGLATADVASGALYHLLRGHREGPFRGPCGHHEPLVERTS
jgi:hypothetical protein